VSLLLQRVGYATVKRSEQAECIAFAQTRGLCHDKKSEHAGCIASAQIQMPLKELQADLGLRAASWNSNETFKLVFASVKNKYSKGSSFTHLSAPITFYDGCSQLIVATASGNTKNIKIPFAAFD
jgi:hypothetical protein